MKFHVKRKLLSWGDDYKILNEAGNDAFIVDGRVMFLGVEISLQDMCGTELLKITKKPFSLFEKYQIYKDGSQVAEVKRVFSIFGQAYSVETSTGEAYEVKGSLFDFEYTFTKNGVQVATVSRNLSLIADSFGVDISTGEDENLILAIVVIIDRVTESRRRRSR